MKCTSTGRKCDGYLRGNPAAGSAARASGVENFVSPLTITPSLHDLDSEQERRSFHFFCSRTLTRLSGFFVAGFWNRWVLQAFHHEPAIRHAVIALGSIHERFDGGDVSVLGSNRDPTRGGFALEQYNHAIHHLIDPAAKGSRPAFDVCLISCVLFACFEVRMLHFLIRAEQSSWPLGLTRSDRDRPFEDTTVRPYPISIAGSGSFASFGKMRRKG